MSQSEKIEDAIDVCAEIDERRAKARAAREAARSAQRKNDLEKIVELEESLGFDLETVETQGRVVEGVPVVVAVRPPSKAEYKRFQAIFRVEPEKSPKRGDAIDQLAKACIVYPEKDSAAFAALLEHFPGTLSSVVPVATRLAELSSTAEKKG